MPIAIGSACARQRHAGALAARVAQRDRPVVVGERRPQHVHEHRLVARGHQHDVRQAAQVGDVEGAVMGRPVVADQPGAIHREDDVEALQADVVDDLVVGALQERGVDRDHRLDPLEGEPGGEQDRLLLGDADVEVALGHRLLEHAQAGAGVHRGRDADDALIAFAFPHERFAEDLRVLRRRGWRRRCASWPWGPQRRRAVEDRLRLGRVPLLHALEAALLGGREALALDGRDVHHDRPFGRERLAQGLAQRAHVVPVDHAHVGPVELLPPQPRRPEGLDRLLQVRPEPLERRADPARQACEAALDARAGVPQLRVQADAVEVARQRADVRARSTCRCR